MWALVLSSKAGLSNVLKMMIASLPFSSLPIQSAAAPSPHCHTLTCQAGTFLFWLQTLLGDSQQEGMSLCQPQAALGVCFCWGPLQRAATETKDTQL